MAAHGIGVSVYCPGPVKSNIVEAGAKRPANLAATGYKPPAGPAAEPARGSISFNDAWMEPEEAGRRILEGVRTNRLYILSHVELRGAIKERHDAIEASWPDEAPNQALCDSIPNLLTTQIYLDEVALGPPDFSRR